MEYKGFVIYPSYTITESEDTEKTYVELYGRLIEGGSFVAVFERKAYFYIRERDLEKAKTLASLQHETTSFRTFADEKVVKVLFSTPKQVPDVRKTLQQHDIICYEADILFAYRFLIDNKIRGGLVLKGKPYSSKEYNSLHGTHYTVDHVFHNPDISPHDHFPNLKVLSIDIETNMEHTQLYSIALYLEWQGKHYEKVLIAKNGGFAKGEGYANEEDVLRRFIALMKELDPDVITGWHVIDFDLVVLRELCKKYAIDFKIGRNASASFIKLSDSFYQDSIAKVSGRVVLDGISLLKNSFVRLPDYKLETAAQHFLEEGKLFTGDSRHEDIDKAFKEKPQDLIDYNLQDAKLVVEILKASNVLDLTIARSKLTRMQLDRVKASIASFDSLYLERLQQHNIVAPTAFAGDRDERIKGGYVRESQPGIYENILVFDFKSLYPSIIRTFNIDPYSFISKENLSQYSEEEQQQCIKAPNGAHFRRELGFLPAIIEDLWKARDKAKEDEDVLRSQAIKILMNSFFGVMANPTFRFYSIEMANAITHFGQELIKKAAEFVEGKGFEVIYGDTDSVFINPKEHDYSAAIARGTMLCVEINTFMQNYIKDMYKRDSMMELEFEKTYKKFFMPRVRGSEQGAKKRYAGILEKKGKEKLDFVGLEFVRSDWTQLAKDFQERLLNAVFAEKDVEPFVRKYVQDIKAGVYDEKLIYRKQIRKRVSEYTKTTPPHIRAARKIGRDEVGIIDYIMTIDGPEEKDHIKHAIDYEHYLEKQVQPIADSVLDFFDVTFDDLVKPERQNSLLRY